MREIKAGDTVLLHKSDGSTMPCLVVNVISQTEVQVINLEISSSFNAATAPIYMSGEQPGQWEPTNEVPAEGIWFSEGLRMANHPIMNMLKLLLNIKLSSDIEEIFSAVEHIYSNRGDTGNPFYEVKHHEGAFADDDYFYNLLMMGIQEGLRSTFYFLQQFLYLTNVIKEQGAALITDVKPTHSGTLGMHVPTLNANYEGFMLLSRATLDRLVFFFKYYFQINKKDGGSNLYALRRYLRKEYNEDFRANKIIAIIDKHCEYLDTQFGGSEGQSTERNKLAHQEYVGFASPNIMYSPDGTVRVVLICKGDLQADGVEELIDRFNKLQSFLVEILTEFFNISLP